MDRFGIAVIPSVEQLAAAMPQSGPRQRHDGWTPDRQRIFLLAVADGHSLRAACGQAGKTVRALYRFNRGPRGQAFALAWEDAREAAHAARHARRIGAARNRLAERIAALGAGSLSFTDPDDPFVRVTISRSR